MPSSGAPTRSKVCGSSVEHAPQQRQQHAGHDEQQRERARVAPQLAQHPAAPVARTIARRLMPPPVPRPAAGTPPRRRPRRCAASSCSARLGRPGSARRASAASRSQRSASSITWLDTSSVVPASASRRKSAHSSRAAPGRARPSARPAPAARARPAAPWPATRAPAGRRTAADDALGLPRPARPCRPPRRRRSAGAPSTRGEVARGSRARVRSA